jgi:translation initiation factor eIF-2B subunit alpha
MRYVTRTSALEYEDFNSAKSRLIERAEKFGEISYKVFWQITARCCNDISIRLFLYAIYANIDSRRNCCLILQARRIIAMLSQDFIFDDCTILVHGFSRVVFEVLKTAAQSKKLFRVFCTGFVSQHSCICLECPYLT